MVPSLRNITRIGDPNIQEFNFECRLYIRLILLYLIFMTVTLIKSFEPFEQKDNIYESHFYLFFERTENMDYFVLN